MPRVYSQGIKMRKYWVSLFNNQRCNSFRWPTLCDTSLSQFLFLRSMACLYGFHTEIQRFARWISTFGNAILTLSVCCTQTWLPMFSGFGFNMKASIRLYQKSRCCSQCFSQSHLKHKHKYKEQIKAHCQFCHGICGISDEIHLEKRAEIMKKNIIHIK